MTYNLTVASNVFSSSVFNSDLSGVGGTPTALYASTGNFATSMSYDICNNRIYVGGSYISKARNGAATPFVCYSSNNGLTWQDGSAIWHNGFGTPSDLKANGHGIVNALAYDSSNNRIYAGGSYDSSGNPNTATESPFVCYGNSALTSINWQDGSAIWHTGFGTPTDYDLTVNGKGKVNALAYDSSKNRIYAGGSYDSSNNSSKPAPFVCHGNSSTTTIGWIDGSAIWQKGFGTPTDYKGSVSGGRVNALAYDSSNNRIYAGGSYDSSANTNTNKDPFVCYGPSSTTSVNWQDGSAIWHNGFDTPTDYDFNGSNGGEVKSLYYELISNRIYAGGQYDSSANPPPSSGGSPFICSSDSNATINWTGGTSLITNGAGDASKQGSINSIVYDYDANAAIYSGYDGEFDSDAKTTAAYTDTTKQPTELQAEEAEEAAEAQPVEAIKAQVEEILKALNASLNALKAEMLVKAKIPVNSRRPVIASTYDEANFLDDYGNFYTGDIVPGSSTICFQKGTHILAPTGYILVENLNAGDQIITKTGVVEIKEMINYTGSRDKNPLYLLPKNSLSDNKPLNDLYMSNTHAYKFGGKWQHMKCSPKTVLLADRDNIEYYHIVVEDYFKQTIIAEGIEVETCFKDKGDGVVMLWVCNNNWCTPLKCEVLKGGVFEYEQKKRAQIESDEKSKTIFKIKVKKDDPEDNKIKNFLLWAYNNKNQENVPLVCNEVSL
jgi:hypothetical protein